MAWNELEPLLSPGIVIFVTGLNIIAAYQAKSQRRDAAFRHM